MPHYSGPIDLRNTFGARLSMIVAWRLIGGVTLLALFLAGPLLWVCYDMAF